MKSPKIIFLFVCVLLIFSGITSKVQAEDFVIVNGVLKEYNGTSANITIPSTVEEIDDWVFNGNHTIQSVVIPSNVKKIGHLSFQACQNLKSVTILGAEEIGFQAFSHCTSLSYLTLPSTLKIINGGAFFYCNNLSNVELPAGLEIIGGYAFSNTSISHVEIPANASEIYSDPFPPIAKLTVTKGSFGQQWAAENNYTVERVINTSVVSPNSISLSRNNLLMGLDGFIPISSTLMPANATNKAVIWTSSDPDVVDMDFPYAGDLRAKGVGTATITATAAGNENIKATCTVTVIACSSENNRIDLPSNLREIKDSAFERSLSITEVVLPNSLTKIGSRAFYDCPCLSEVYIPDSVSIIEDTAFLYDSHLHFSCQSENAGAKYARENNISFKIVSDQSGQ